MALPISLLDLKPRREKVVVGKDDEGNNLTVEARAIALDGIAALIERFPDMEKMLTGSSTVDAKSLFKFGPAAVAAIIALGTGYKNNTDAEELAGSLPVEVQLDLLTAIGRCSFPNGIGPFVEKLEAIAASVNIGRAPDMNSLKQQRDSLLKATERKTSGDTAQDKSTSSPTLPTSDISDL